MFIAPTITGHYVTLTGIEQDVRGIVERVSNRLLEQGAKATVLVGSHARGEARDDSDIDLFAVGDGPKQHVELVDGRTVTIHWFTPDEVRQRLTSPEAALISVCGWREGVVVEDPLGLAAELQGEAAEWSWDRIEAEADAYAVDELVNWAEYAHKLSGALDTGRTIDAAALTADAGLRLGRVVAIRARVNAKSENAF